MRNLKRVCAISAVLGGLTVSLAFAQAPAFDAVSIKVVKLSSHPTFGNWGGPGTKDPGRLHLCCVGMFSLVMRAFDVELDQISGPAWIMDNSGPNLYQLDATMPASTTKAQLQVMLQNLLRDRFHMQFHREKRNYPGYELIIAEGGAKLKESKPGPQTASSDISQPPKRAADGTLVLPPGPQLFTSLGAGVIIVQAQEKPLDEFVKGLGRIVAQSLGENPNDFESPKPRVIDNTGLTGLYDFTLRFACEACQFAAVNGGFPAAAIPMDGSTSDVPSIFVALPRQLGLKLIKTRDIALDVIAIDHIDKSPTRN
jgi:uncharacterized protein (TIGR03435 family)